MDEDAAAGSRATRVDWDALAPAVERAESTASDESSTTDDDSPTPNDASPTPNDASPTPNDETDQDALAAAVVQADEASWTPRSEDDADEGEGEDEGEPVDDDGTQDDDEPGGDASDEWADLTPAVERVAPVQAVTRVEEEATADDFTNPAADFAQSDVGDEPTAPAMGQQGPPDDTEQPLAVHIEEMVKRLGIVVAIAGAVSLALFPLTGEVINFLWYSILPGTDVAAPHVYHPLEYMLTQLKVASLGGLLIALPVFVYQTYRFMRPGLYPHERRYYLASVPTSLILGLLGVTFAYFVVLPAIMSYFLYYSQEVVTIAFALGATFDLILLLMGYLAVVFQIPLFVMLAIMMGLTTRQWLEDRRLIFWGAFLGVSFLFSPDPTGMAPVLVAATMVVLFEGTLLLLRWTGR